MVVRPSAMVAMDAVVGLQVLVRDRNMFTLGEGVTVALDELAVEDEVRGYVL